ncbi:MAG: filamentous hemagglutinin N-terminal domain-containing protein [Xenococcus sp. MO_188.B8]|nr:filamentous hemagglutinin N-terminal domain-containing protein [Xenococcus sp. MO_188.B8]
MQILRTAEVKQGLSLLLFLGCCTLSQGFFLKPALAQITPDGTTNTTVDVSGNDFTIEQGNRAGGNLFHSFSEFSVPTDGSAFFNNAADIVNIFSRVTGGNISTIDGLLSANGTANLFLINPAGIIFGEGARLDIGGSFYGSTADSILFPDGEFSATDAQAQPILTINAPIGLNFRDNPGEIRVEKSNLGVNSGQNLALIGGEIDLDGARLNVSGGRVELGASALETVTFDNDGSLSFEQITERKNISLSNNSTVSVNGQGGGSINIYGRNLELIGESSLVAGIAANSSNPEAQAGNIVIDVSEAVSLDEASIISNNVGTKSLGNAGDIEVSGTNVSLVNDSRITSISQGTGNTGNVIINTSENVTLENGEVKSQILDTGEGTAGNIEITTVNLSLENDSVILSDTQGIGNAGNTIINASNSVSLNDSEIVGGVGLGDITTPAQGDGGNIEITTGSISLQNESRILANLENGRGIAGNVIINTTGDVSLDNSNIQAKIAKGSEGTAGSIEITTANLSLTNRGRIIASTSGQGNGGAIKIDASETIFIDEEDQAGFNSGIVNRVDAEGMGNAGSIEITTTNLSLTNGGFIDASTFGKGDAGTIKISASETISLDGADNEGSNSFIRNRVEPDGMGNAGSIEIITTNLSLTNGGRIIASTSGKGNGGAIKIDASENIFLDLEDESGLTSSIVNRVDETGIGNAGSIEISTTNLSLTNGGRIDASTFGRGDAGAISIKTAEDISIDGESQQRGLSSGIFNRVQAEGTGNAGSIEINTSNLYVTNGGRINATTFGQGNAGAIKINALETISLDGESPQMGLSSGIVNRVQEQGRGNAGGIEITTTNLSLTNEGLISVSAFGEGNGGNILVRANSINLDRGNIFATNRPSELDNSIRDRVGGNITLELTGQLILKNDSLISSQAGNNATGGNINIDSQFIIAFPSQPNGSDIIANAEAGKGGNINITSEVIFNIKERPAIEGNETNDIDVSSRFGLDGNVLINTPDVNPLQRDIEAPTNIIESEQTVAQACQSARNSDQPSGLTVKGKGGIPPVPTEPFDSDTLLVDEQNITSKPQTHYPEIKPIKTSIGDIYPARGVIKTEDGRVILTIYPTDNINTRIPQISANCSLLKDES